MPATYDRIGAQYEEYAARATLKRAEHHTFSALVGPLAGERVLDVACGHGYYTRLLVSLGAGEVIGSDVSPEMIRLAREAEAAAPLGIRYRIADGADLPDEPPFDLVTAVWLLNYAGTVARLRGILRDVHDRLRPGGRFVTVTIAPDYDLGRANMTRYGIEVLSDEPRGDPPRLVGRFMTDPPSAPVTVDHWSRGVIEDAFAAAGLVDVRWERFRVSDALREEYGAAYWADLLEHGIAIALVARRPG